MRGRKPLPPFHPAPIVLTSSKTTEAALTKEGIRFAALTDTYTLARNILGYTEMTESFHGPLCRFLDSTPYPRNLYLAARLHFKTSIITVARNVRRILNDPQIRILIASNKEDNAAKMLVEIQQRLRTPLLVWAFPEILHEDPAHQAEKWTKTALSVKRRYRREATVEAIGISGELTSNHYDHGTWDDLVGKENSENHDQIEATKEWWRNAQALLDVGATLDLVGTPWAPDDLYAHLLEQRAKHGYRLGVFKRACWENAQGEVPSVPDETTTPTFPERFSLPFLLELRLAANMGSEVFAAQMLLNPEDASTAVFDRRKIRPYIQSRGQIITACGGLDRLWIAMTVDPAISTKAWADYTAIAVGGFDRDGILWILDLRRGRWAEDRTLTEIYDCWERTQGIRAIGFEAVGFAQIYRRLLTQEGERRGYQLPIVRLERDNKMKKNIRIRGLQPYWESGGIRIANDVPALDDFLEEASRFRTYKENEHDDLLDAVVDLYQLRLRPAEHRPDYLTGDAEVDARIQFEATLLAKAPDMDRASLRQAWLMQRHRDQRRQTEVHEMIGADVGEAYMVG